jgi:uncharacterized LabA/DUF88 family protein
MLIAELVVLVAIVAGHFFTKTKHARFFEDRVKQQDGAEEGRRIALYKIQKANENEIAKTQKAVQVLANQSRALHDEARLVHGRVDQHFAHPAIKAITNGEG